MSSRAGRTDLQSSVTYLSRTVYLRGCLPFPVVQTRRYYFSNNFATVYLEGCLIPEQSFLKDSGTFRVHRGVSVRVRESTVFLREEGDKLSEASTSIKERLSPPTNVYTEDGRSPFISRKDSNVHCQYMSYSFDLSVAILYHSFEAVRESDQGRWVLVFHFGLK